MTDKTMTIEEILADVRTLQGVQASQAPVTWPVGQSVRLTAPALAKLANGRERSRTRDEIGQVIGGDTRTARAQVMWGASVEFIPSNLLEAAL